MRWQQRCTACGIACPGVRDGGPPVLFKGHPLRCPVWEVPPVLFNGTCPLPSLERNRDRTSGYPPIRPETGPAGILPSDQRQDQRVSSIRPGTGPAGILPSDQRQDQRVSSHQTRDRTSGYPHQDQRQDQRVSSHQTRDRTRYYSLVDRQTPLKKHDPTTSFWMWKVKKLLFS